MVVPRRGEESKDMLGLALGVLLTGNSSEIREGDLMAKFGLGLVTVYGQEIGPQDNVDGFPRLCLASTLGDLAGLDDAVEFETAILVDGRESVEGELTSTELLNRVGQGLVVRRSDLNVGLVGDWARGRVVMRRVRHDGGHGD